MRPRVNGGTIVIDRGHGWTRRPSWRAVPIANQNTSPTPWSRARSWTLSTVQPRQDDLLAYLADEVDQDTLERLAGELKIDIAPPALGT